MKLYLLENPCQTRVGYRSAVVLANTEQEARETHPDGGTFPDVFWTDRPEVVVVKYLGQAAKQLEKNFPKRVVLAYFHEE